MSLHERRTHARSPVNVPALVAGEDGVASHFLVENVSAGGLLVVGSPPPVHGEFLEIFLRLSDEHMFRVEGTVVRREVAGGEAVAFGVKFDEPHVALGHHLRGSIRQNALTAPLPLLERTLVVEPDRERCRQTVTDLRRIGIPTLATLNSDDALELLDHSHCRFTQVLAAEHLRGGSGHDLLATVARRWPHVRRILVRAADAAAATTNVGTADLILTAPWDPTRLLFDRSNTAD